MEEVNVEEAQVSLQEMTRIGSRMVIRYVILYPTSLIWLCFL